jgi:hypothetical protein
VSGWVSFVANGLVTNLDPGEIIWVLGPPSVIDIKKGYVMCSSALTRLGIGLVANHAIHDFTVKL